jgi:transposase
VAYISRDRSNEYTRGASEGAPAAQHVADRWHILKNLREVLERLLGRVHTQLKHRYEASIGPARPRGKQRRTKKERMEAEMARLQRESRYEQVVNFYRQGTPILRIAEELHMSRTTVRKFVVAEAFPEPSSTLRSKSILDPYVPYLRQRLMQGPVNASQLWRDLQAQGFSGGYKVIARWLQEQGWQLRKGRSSQARKMVETPREFPTPEKPSPQEQDLLASISPPSPATLVEPLESPRHLVWLFLQDATRLGKPEQQMLSFIRQEPVVDLAYTLAQQFVHLLREHRVEELESWLSTCMSSGLSELETFASGLRKELSALQAAVRLPYSNGPVEGHVNRLKLIKRSMYNRGSFDLLRRRVLYSGTLSPPLHQSCG